LIRTGYLADYVDFTDFIDDSWLANQRNQLNPCIYVAQENWKYNKYSLQLFRKSFDFSEYLQLKLISQCTN
jgi:hypothetical protein